MFASREQVISLMEKATMGMEELTDSLRNPVADAQKLLESMKEEVGAAAMHLGCDLYRTTGPDPAVESRWFLVGGWF